MVTRIELCFIRILTSFVWWVDVRFGKDVEWCSKRTFIFFIPFSWATAALLHDWAYDSKPDPVWSLLEFVLFYFFMKWLWDTSDMIKKYVQGMQNSPNQNVHSSIFLKSRIVSISLLLLMCSLYGGGVVSSRIVIGMIGYGLSSLFTYYLFCVDRIPPEEKQKRKEKNEERALQPVLQ